jgi:hypothetical protein
MSLLDNKKNILQSLQLLRDRIYSAFYYEEPRKTNDFIFDSADGDSCYDADDEMPLFQVINAAQYLTNEGEFMIGNKWMQFFFRRIERTVWS